MSNKKSLGVTSSHSNWMTNLCKLGMSELSLRWSGYLKVTLEGETNSMKLR